MNRIAAAAVTVSIVALAAYLMTLSPTIHVGDSGELASAAATLGIAHPPGYPLWTILGRTAVLLGVGSPALSTNVLSALAAAGAAGLLAVVLSMLTGRLLVSAGAALAFALCRGVWSTAVVTEVYSLNLLMTIAVLAAALGGRRGRPGLFLLAAYLLGLGTANHPFVLQVAPLVAALALIPSGRHPEPVAARLRRLLPMFGLFVLGISAYLYLPIRWSAGADWVWGGPREFGDLLDHVLRVQYGGLGEAASDSSIAMRWRVFGEILAGNLPLVFSIAALFGLGQLVREGHPKRAALLLVFFLVAGPVTAGMIRFEDTFLDRSVASVFFLPAAMAAWLLAGVGLAAIDRLVTDRLGGRRGVGLAVTAILALAAPVHLARANIDVCDRSESTLARDYADEIFRELPEHARLYAKGDNEVFILAYFHRVEGRRPDVELIDWTMNLGVEAWGEDVVARPRPERPAARRARELELAFAEQDRPVFYTDLVDMSGYGGCRLEPNGLLQQLLRPGEPAASLPFRVVPAAVVDPDDFLESHLASVVRYRQGKYLLRRGMEAEGRAQLLAVEEDCADNPIVMRNLALAFRDLGDAERAERWLRETIDVDPANGDALFDLGTMLATLGRPGESVECFDRLIAAGFDLPEVHLNRGAQLVLLGDLAAATQSAVRALELAPGLEPAKRLAESVARGYEIGGEEGLLEARRGLGMITIEGTLQLAARYLEQGEVQRATDLYREASESAPESAAAAYGLGYGLLKVGRWAEAGDAFRRILGVDPESADGRNALAYVFSQTGDSLDVAERLASEAVDLNPQLSGYWLDTLGWVRYRRGAHEGALEALLESKRRIPPDDIGMRAENGYHLGVVLLALGRSAEAREHLRSSLALAEEELWVPDLKAKARDAGLAEGDA